MPPLCLQSLSFLLQPINVIRKQISTWNNIHCLSRNDSVSLIVTSVIHILTSLLRPDQHSYHHPLLASFAPSHFHSILKTRDAKFSFMWNFVFDSRVLKMGLRRRIKGVFLSLNLVCGTVCLQIYDLRCNSRHSGDNSKQYCLFDRDHGAL